MRGTLSPQPRSLWLDIGRLRGDFPDAFSCFPSQIWARPLIHVQSDEATALRGQLEAPWATPTLASCYLPFSFGDPLLLHVPLRLENS